MIQTTARLSSIFHLLVKLLVKKIASPSNDINHTSLQFLSSCNSSLNYFRLTLSIELNQLDQFSVQAVRGTDTVMGRG